MNRNQEPASGRAPVVVTLGNPNTGKSTLFNRLTGLKQKVSNYPGVTVEQVSGRVMLGDLEIQLVDVPGTYSLAANSPDEMIAVDVLHGVVPGLARPALAVVVVDASNLRRNLYLVTQILEAGLPVVVALNMVDRLEQCGVTIDTALLQNHLGVPVVPIAATNGEGIDALKSTMRAALATPTAPTLVINPDIDAAVARLASEFGRVGDDERNLELRRALLDANGYAEQRLVREHGERALEALQNQRHVIGGGRSLATLEARDRYSWIQQILKDAERRDVEGGARLRDTADALVSHPIIGSALFVIVMGLVFQAVFAWAGPLVDGVDYLTSSLAERVAGVLAPGLFSSFITDGVIAGVGSVVIFLPQILILFAFIIVLEDSGYMARGAFLMDRVMRGMGLSGQSFIPMLSSFACAVPGIMGARIIANQYDRLATIMAAPFMTCSARLPIYSLLIAAFIPDTRYLNSWINLQGLLLLGLYLLGILGGAMTAWFISRLYWARAKSRFLLEMPPYRMPNLRAVTSKLLSRALIFLRRAGTIIFSAALVIWVLASFPRNAELDGLANVDNGPTIEASYLGQMSVLVAPLFAPLGWDWKVTAAVLASFPAREVVIAALGTIYAVETETEDGTKSLTNRIKSARHADGSLVYTVPMVVGLLIFYAFCLQCVSTIAVMRRETGTWRWPLIAWVYMTSLGYVGAFIAFRFGTWMQL